MLGIVLKGTVLLAAAFAAVVILRRRSASLRHFVWTAAFAALLLLPFVAQVPNLRVVVSTPAIAAPIEGTSIAVRAAHPDRPGGPAPQSRIPWLPVVYGAGLLTSAAWFLTGAVHTARLVRRGVRTPQVGPDVVLAAVPMPLAWGILRPVVVLPPAARQWPEPRLRSVLLHERMHHRRRDLLTQSIAQAACCLFWFHPLAWMALVRQRIERENACDDAVLRHGIAAHDYASHLMDVVRAAAGRRRRWADAPAMAEGSNLEARVRTLLDGTRDRRPLTAVRAIAIATAVAAVLLPLAALQLRGQSAGGTLAGTVKDPSGAVVPGCTVTVKDAAGVSQGTAVTDQVGVYRVPGLAGGQYSLEFSARGFARGKVTATLVGGATAKADFNLSVGQINETVSVTGRKSAVVPKPQVAPQRIKVGGNVQAARLVRQPRPVYPPELQAAGVEGTVVLQAVVLKDGSVGSIKVIRSAGHTLDEAAVAAVKQWQYTPTLLNGEPVEIVTTIDVAFQLEQ